MGSVEHADQYQYDQRRDAPTCVSQDCAKFTPERLLNELLHALRQPVKIQSLCRGIYNLQIL